MGRKEFYERLEELNRMRKELVQRLKNIDARPTDFKLLRKIESEISQLKLLQQN
ncbi:MAG TPA: hypothetical protein PLK12_08415 [Prolixibacteraceae bacterium]|nr:hypothetical protein [Prolixibacteraceae bacterium]